MAADPLTTSAVDDLFNDNFSDFDEDPFADKPALQDTRDDKPVLSPRAGLKRKSGDQDGLGLDEEVKIVKKRKPIAKLDEARLLSEPGLPKLRSIIHSKQLLKKLRIKGKGHEFTDAAKLLNHFQLWLDNLYPRAKFADALQLVEKAGHSKRMHIMRSEWIDEGKPGYKRYDVAQQEDDSREEPDLFGNVQAQAKMSSQQQANSTAQPSESTFGHEIDDDALFIPDANRPAQLHGDDEPDDDELDALLAMQDEPRQTHAATRQEQEAEESEGEDDLDALLAEQNTLRSRPAPKKAQELRSEEEDDLDALLAEHDTRPSHPEPEADGGSLETRQAAKQLSTQQVNADSDDEDDLGALLAMQRTRSKPTTEDPEPSLPTPQHTSSPLRHADGSPQKDRQTVARGNSAPMFSSSPIPNNPEELDLDDLDALLASQEAKMNAKAQAQEQQRTPKAKKVMDAMDDLLSSPVPNGESQ